MLGQLSDVILFWTAAFGLALAVLSGAWGRTLALVTPAIMRWCVWPVVAPSILDAFAHIPWWEKVIALPFAVLFIAFAGIKALQGAVTGIYGSHVSVRVTSHALIATFRAFGRLLGFAFTWPISIFKNRQTMDERLRRWRRH